MLLPLTSILAMLWLWNDTHDTERIASLAQGHFLVRPAVAADVPVLPALLRSGVEFWPALLASCALTIALYFGMVWALGRLGITL